MEIKERHFPYPIMAGWSDDIKFNATSDLKAEADKKTNTYILSYTVTLKNKTMLQMLQDGRSKMILHLECSNALYRKIFTLNIPPAGMDAVQGKITVSGDDICGAADATLLLVADQDIPNYAPEGIHSDYSGITCSLKKGDFIASLGTTKIPLRQDYDLLRQISSIIVFNRDEKRDNGPIVVDFSEDKLIAMLPKKLHESYLVLKDRKECTGILTSMLVMPVLMEGLDHIKTLWAERGSQSEKWFNLLCKKLEDMNCDMSNSSSLVTAQKIFDMPYERANKELKALLGQTI